MSRAQLALVAALVGLTACSNPPAATQKVAPPQVTRPGSFRFDGLPLNTRAGNSVQFFLASLDSAGRPMGGYVGKVHFTSDDPQAQLPDDTTFAAGDEGLRAFTATFRTSGQHRLFARDVDEASALGGSPTVLVTAGVATSLALASGDGQTNSVLNALHDPLVVLARDGFGNPAPGARVHFTAIAGGGSVAPEYAGSDANGLASAVATLGGTVGQQRFRADLDGATPVEFTAQAQDVTPASIVLVSGDAQIADTGEPLPHALVVKVLDAFGNPAPNVAVSWASTGPGAQGTVTPSAPNTDVNGQVSAQATIGGPRPHLFTASVAGLAPVSFSAWPNGLSYVDPPAGGALRFELDPSATPQHLTLNLVATRDLSAYSVGFDMPLGAVKVLPVDLVPGVLSPGTNPPAAKAKTLLSGPNKGMVLVALSQKRAGDGAVDHDTTIHAGDVLLQVALGGAVKGAVFDGVPPGFKGGLLDMAGNAVLRESDFALGKLENH